MDKNYEKKMINWTFYRNWRIMYVQMIENWSGKTIKNWNRQKGVSNNEREKFSQNRRI